MQNFGGNNNRFVRGGQGGGGFGQGRKGGRGRGGRGGRGRGNNNNNNSGQGGSGQGQGQGGGGQGIKQLCIHFLRGACNQGDNCRYSHDISVVTNIPQVGGDIKAIAINSTGSIFVAAGQSIQVYDTSSGSINCSGSRDFEGLIHHIEAIDSYLVVGYDYPPSQFPGNTVGLVTVLDIQNNQSYQLIRSDSIPYTHPVRVSKFIVEKFGDDIYVFTCGTEGMIHVWCFNPTTSSVSHAFGLEGHIREVSSLALQGNYLWSGSHDFTLKIWDLNSRDICLTFRPPENENFENSPESGHSAGVTCITKVLVGSDLYVVTSSNDGYVIIWNGDQKYYDFGEQDGVTALSSAHDLSGEPIIILGLQNGFIVIRRWTNPEEFILLDKPGLKHNGPVYSITQLAPGVIATGGGDQSIHVWKIDKPLFN